jgi:hypothetical protein
VKEGVAGDLVNFGLSLKTSVCQNALQYYLIIPSESHRESWDNIMLLLLTKLYKLDAIKVILLGG